jgi:hypothetical protein
MAYRVLWWAFPVAVLESRAQLRSFRADAVSIPDVRFSQSPFQGLLLPMLVWPEDHVFYVVLKSFLFFRESISKFCLVMYILFGMLIVHVISGSSLRCLDHSILFASNEYSSRLMIRHVCFSVMQFRYPTDLNLRTPVANINVCSIECNMLWHGGWKN